jgi:type I restriction enzyme S subunit
MTSMLLDCFRDVVDGPEAIPVLRRLLRKLAVQGRLVPQHAADRVTRRDLEEAVAALKAAAQELGLRAWKVSIAVGGSEPKPGFPLPHGWVWGRVNDTGIYVNGHAFKPSDYTSEGLPIIRIQNLTDGTRSHNYAQGEFPKTIVVNPGDLLVSWSASLDAFMWRGPKGLLNQHIFKVFPNKRLFIPPFLFILLREVMGDISDGEFMRGLTMRHVRRGPFLNHIVGVPPLAEQERIVQRFDELTALCDELEAAQAERDRRSDQLVSASLGCLVVASDERDADAYRESAQFCWNQLPRLTRQPEHVAALRRAVLDLAGRGKLVSQDADDQSVSMHLDQRRPATTKGHLKQGERTPLVSEIPSLPFKLPPGWESLRLDNLLQAGRGISYGVIKLEEEPESGGVPTLRCSDVKSRRLDLTRVRRVSEEVERNYLRTRLVGGEIVINIRGTLGGVAVVPAELAGYNVAREVAVVPISPGIVDPHYIMNVMASSYFWDAIRESLRGIAYKGLNLKTLRQFPIPVPPLAEQQRIVTKVNELMATCDELEERLSQAEDRRGELLAAALNEALNHDVSAVAEVG